MSAANRFKNNASFGTDRLKPLPPIYREEKDDKGITKQVFDRVGVYRAKIHKCIWVDPRKGPDLFIAELEVVKSNNEKAGVGQRFAFKQNMELDAANARVVEFVFAGSGVDRRTAEGLAIIKEAEAKEQIPAMLAEALEDPKDPENCKNSLKGQLVDIEVEERTAQNGFPYKHYSFFPVKDEEQKS